MCGIAGYIGKKEGLPIVFANLRKLEYRGYDSAGVAFFDFQGEKRHIKTFGKIDMLEKAIQGQKSLPLTAVIGHTRWATHGVPSEANAHPHYDCKKEIFLVHNGIIENYQELKEQLLKKGHHFRSQTDTEVAAHLIEEYGLEPALKKIVGAYAFAVINTKEPQKIYVARLGSPLVIGISRDGYYVASDPTALAGLVKKVIYLKDGQHGYLSLNDYKIGPARPKIEHLDIDVEKAQKGNFPHFMLKEIFEGPEVVEAALRGRLSSRRGMVKLGGLEDVAHKFENIKKFEIYACGTSYYAGLIAEMLLEEFTGIPSEITLASEYRYKKDAPQKNTACLFISQSGETADTLAALRKANQRKLLTLGIVNGVGSNIARETVAGVYNHAGPEIGVASTKAFLSQLAVLSLVSLYARQNKTKTAREFMKALAEIPNQIRGILKNSAKIKAIAEKYLDHQNFLYIGRGYNYPTALEGALKIKEIAYVHAEGYAAG
ncbi:MAG: glutamine--fructose-6-phosphate transaminase (isomerizing), partial [Patescibacteria group bacterium]